MLSHSAPLLLPLLPWLLSLYEGMPSGITAERAAPSSRTSMASLNCMAPRRNFKAPGKHQLAHSGSLNLHPHGVTPSSTKCWRIKTCRSCIHAELTFAMMQRLNLIASQLSKLYQRL